MRVPVAIAMGRRAAKAEHTPDALAQREVAGGAAATVVRMRHVVSGGFTRA